MTESLCSAFQSVKCHNVVHSSSNIEPQMWHKSKTQTSKFVCL